MKRSVNILLIVVLAALIGGLGFFSYKLIFQKDKILVPDFSNATYSEINTWCNNLETNPCSFEYEYSDTVAKDGLIYQSLSADTELSDSITFIISAGKQIEIKLPEITADSTKDLIAKWISENNIKNPVEYVEEYSNKVEENYVIRYETSVITDEAQTIKVYVSKGHKPSTEDGIVVEAEKYLDLTEDAFKTKAKELKLTPNHNTERDDYSETIEKGKIVWHGSGTYEENETINYGLSLGKNADAIVIKKGEYVGKTLTEFEEAIKKLGLVAEHYDTDTYHDETSETIEKGSLDWHGSGTYAKGETIHYTLSLGKSGEKKSKPVDFKQNQFQGKTLAEFTAEVSVYDLKPEHNTSWDDYSATIAKGNIIRHGYGTYEKNETTIRYGLSLGPKGNDPVNPDVPDTPTIKQVTVDGSKYMNISVDSFKSKISELGLSTNHNSNYDAYSSYPEGNICWYNSGTFDEGSTISYGVSKGVEKKHLNGFSMIANSCESIGNYDQTASNVESYFAKQGFNNVECVGAKGGADDESIGVIMSISINGSSSYSAGDYPIDASIVVTICNEVQN